MQWFKWWLEYKMQEIAMKKIMSLFSILNTITSSYFLIKEDFLINIRNIFPITSIYDIYFLFNYIFLLMILISNLGYIFSDILKEKYFLIIVLMISILLNILYIIFGMILFYTDINIFLLFFLVILQLTLVFYNTIKILNMIFKKNS